MWHVSGELHGSYVTEWGRPSHNRRLHSLSRGSTEWRQQAEHRMHGPTALFFQLCVQHDQLLQAPDALMPSPEQTITRTCELNKPVLPYVALVIYHQQEKRVRSRQQTLIPKTLGRKKHHLKETTVCDIKNSVLITI